MGVANFKTTSLFSCFLGMDGKKLAYAFGLHLIRPETETMVVPSKDPEIVQSELLLCTFSRKL